MKLTNDVTLLIFSAVNNGIFVVFFVTGVDYQQVLIESTSVFCFNDRLACTIKQNIK